VSVLHYRADPMVAFGLRQHRCSQEAVPLDSLPAGMVVKFGSSVELSRQLLQEQYDKLHGDNSRRGGGARGEREPAAAAPHPRAPTDQAGLGAPSAPHHPRSTMMLREAQFVAIAPKLVFVKQMMLSHKHSTPFEMSFTLPSNTLFQQVQRGTTQAQQLPDMCGAFHMRARYGFQHELGENQLSDTIDWCLGRVDDTLSGTGTAAALDDGGMMDDAGWFNPLVYQGGARLRPREPGVSILCAFHFD
jgi:hypothetical protein